MIAYNDNVNQIFKKEKLIVDLSTLVKNGMKHISNLKDWIAATFRNNDPNGKQPRYINKKWE